MDIASRTRESDEGGGGYDAEARAEERGAEEYGDLGGAVFAADCRARLAFEVIANRWDSVVVYVLGELGPLRPRALLDRIGGISPKVLNESLRRLEYNGLVEHRRYAEAPPRVDYALTGAGAALIGPIRALGAWSAVHGDAVLAAQETHEKKRGI
ncbi:HxlR family transcriptional regulator [Streptomyces sp. 1114.5]|uniref:winged helix-turn-helix transcriptional regulator n=1 Tax=Streptomyces sp. 1114.5 TaxID=1938830 RepID=UPI000EB16DC2|nr:HxlR family transcriptional regulator [Streptomyces sp. 1114.5]